ncbi:VCBS repeat-containing protein [Saprospiraceae bacterium]|nr:VCBS repeat-containing protein [Saprospiraceae bacterium]
MSSCTETETLAPRFELLSSEKTGLNFENKLPINLDLNIFNYMYYFNGGGTAVGDLNNDGLTDIIFTSNLDAEQIFINEGKLKFKDVSDIAKVDGGPNSWTNGVSIVDINEDGKLDIYLSQVGSYKNIDCQNRLFICTEIDSQGIPHYEEKSKEYGLDFKGFSTQAGFFDYDLDGDLDMYLMNHSLHHNGTFGQRKDFINTVSEISGDKIYRNDEGKFVDVTKSTGINSSVIGYGLGLAFGDFNNDGYPDIYIGNDFHENDYLYINNQDGTFSESIEKQIKHTSRFSMGVDIADINNDEFQDIISLDMLPEDPYILKTSEGEDALDIFNFKLGYGYNHQYAKNAVQLNQGNGTFKEIATYSGVHATDWSWSPLFVDFDMDGKKDLFISNGIPKRMNDIDYINYMSGNDIQYKIQFDQLKKQDMGALEKIPEIRLENKFYRNGQDLQFEDQKLYIKNDKESYSNSAAYADFDNDGDYDIITNNINQKAFIYENLQKTESVEVKLVGSRKNKFAFGARVKAYYKGECRDINYNPTRGFQSSMVSKILIPKQHLDSIIVIWPENGFSQQAYKQDSIVIFEQSRSLQTNIISIEPEEIKVQDITEETGINIIHKENPFVEFNREPLIPFSTSAEGPAIAVGDINGDMLEDLYVGSSKRKRSQLYLQNKNGTFINTPLQGMPSDSIYEEISAKFVDIDNDGDLDLIVATGGNEYRLNSPYTTPLLYRNTNGQLKRDTKILKDFHVTASCLVANDFDSDGDIDIFIGARATPRQYGVIPKSLYLVNDGNGRFVNEIEKYFGSSELGFVKDAQLIDLNEDSKMDLVLALEWDGIVSFTNQKNKFNKDYLYESKGLWNSLTIGDINGDGKIDIFAGNLGKNSRLKASNDEPIKMYYNDFDDNGVSEQVLTYFIGGREVPFSNMMELQKQIPSLKKKYLYAKDFASSSINELFSADKIETAEIFYATDMENTLLINKGNGNFSKETIPSESQFTSYYGGLIFDVNRDGLNDIIPAGNYHYCNVQMGRYDTENGSVLAANGKGGFHFINMSNFPVQGQVKGILPISINGKNAFVFAQNSDQLKILTFE